MDPQTAAADTAKQDAYKQKLAATKAQSNIDSAKADRNAAMAKADDAG